MTKKVVIGMALGAVGVVVFGGTLPFTTMAVAELSTWFVTFGRSTCAGILAFIVMLIMRKKLVIRENLGALLGCIVTLVIGFPILAGIALQTVPASHAGVVLGLMPLATAYFGTKIAGEKLSMRFWVWSLIGSALVGAFTLRNDGLSFGIGDFLLILSGLSASLGYAIAGTLSRKMPGWEVLCRFLVLAWPLVFVGTLFNLPSSPNSISSTAWIGFAYVTLFSTFIGFGFWNAGLAMGGVARVGQLQLLQPFVTLIGSWILLSEFIPIEAWLFAALIIVAVIMGQTKPSTSKKYPPKI